MTLSAQQISQLMKLRGLGWSQEEIAKNLGVSRQVVGYNLKKLKEKSKDKGIEEVFQAALIGGLAGAVAGIGLYSILNSFQSEK